jgi:ABC-type cobalamin transport system permease subunit
MTSLSLIVVIVAIGGITGCLIYLRIALRDASRRRLVDQLVIACTVATMLGFGLVTWNCIFSGSSFKPQRIEFFQRGVKPRRSGIRLRR